MIKVENYTKSYGNQVILHDVNFEINQGEVVGIIGPSGTGKSILLRSLMMLEKPTSGSIIFDGTDITKLEANLDEVHKKIGMVFQNFNLFNHLCVVENVMSGLVDLLGIPQDEAFEKSMKLLKDVGMADKAFLYPDTLSGGQKQRVAIARTLAMDPEIILLDEPTSSLDPLMRGEVEAVIKMVASQGRTMIIVTHEMELVKSICTRVLFLDEKSIYEEGTPDKIFNSPERERTRLFVRAIQTLELNIASKDFDFIGTQTLFEEFGYKNSISRDILEKLTSIMEELFQMVIIQPKDQNKMNIVFEYNKAEKFLFGTVKASGPKIDPDDPMYFFSWPIIVHRATEIQLEDLNEDGFTNLIKIKI